MEHTTLNRLLLRVLLRVLLLVLPLLAGACAQGDIHSESMPRPDAVGGPVDDMDPDGGMGMPEPTDPTEPTDLTEPMEPANPDEPSDRDDQPTDPGEPEPTFACGDLDDDGRVTLADYRDLGAILDGVAPRPAVGSREHLAADILKDGRLSERDHFAMAMIIQGRSLPSFECQPCPEYRLDGTETCGDLDADGAIDPGDDALRTLLQASPAASVCLHWSAHDANFAQTVRDRVNEADDRILSDLYGSIETEDIDPTDPGYECLP